MFNDIAKGEIIIVIKGNPISTIRLVLTGNQKGKKNQQTDIMIIADNTKTENYAKLKKREKMQHNSQQTNQSTN